MPWSPTPNIRGLIFDCDGTLADTMPVHYKAWTTMLGRHGITFPASRFYAMGGMPTATIVRILAEEAGVTLSDIPAMVVEKEAMFLAVLDSVRPIDAVYRIAEKHRGVLPMAVASGGYRRVVERTLAKIGAADWFQAVVCAEDTPRHKPEPDVFLEAARRLEVEATACVVFEDTDIGLEAARRAGMVGVDVRPWYRVE